MEKTIIDIIDKKAIRQYRGMTDTKKKAYRAMLYAGTQVTLNGYSVREVATEIGYSESGTAKLVQKWIELMKNGDITVNLITTAINRLSKSKRFHHSEQVSSHTTPTTPTIQPKETIISIATKDSTPKSNGKGKNVLGFIITPEDERRERAAIRASILFFQSYGKGRQPRMNGEYYTPGTSPDVLDADDGKWLPLDTAALYCGCKEEIISVAGKNGSIERRVYRRNSNRNYYEYKLEDLDRFIRDNRVLQ